MIFRYGGEAFLLCLPDTDVEGATVVCEALRKGIAALTLHLDSGEAARITVSIGLASLAADLDVDTAIGRAESALHAAKAAGRDRTLAWSPDMEGPEPAP